MQRRMREGLIFLMEETLFLYRNRKRSVFNLFSYSSFFFCHFQQFKLLFKSNLKTRWLCFLPSLSLPMLLMLLMLLPDSSRRTVCRFVAETVAVVTFHSSAAAATGAAAAGAVVFHRRRTISLEVTNFPALFTSFSLGIKRVRQNARAEKKH
jgi:hypothetical protein